MVTLYSSYSLGYGITVIDARNLDINMSTLIYIFVITDAITIQTDPAWAVPQHPTAQENDGEAGESL